MLHRRSALRMAVAALAAAGLGRIGAAQGVERSTPGLRAERRFEIRVRIELAPSMGALRVWVPAQIIAPGWSQCADANVSGNADVVELVQGPPGMVLAQWKSGAEAPTLETLSLLATRDHAARQAFGLRITPSTFGRTTLCANGGPAAMSRHCSAEAWLDEAGWFSVDPAGLRTPSGSESGPFGQVVYPRVETVTGLFDCFDPHGFRFEITAREAAA